MNSIGFNCCAVFCGGSDYLGGTVNRTRRGVIGCYHHIGIAYFFCIGDGRQCHGRVGAAWIFHIVVKNIFPEARQGDAIGFDIGQPCTIYKFQVIHIDGIIGRTTTRGYVGGHGDEDIVHTGTSIIYKCSFLLGPIAVRREHNRGSAFVKAGRVAVVRIYKVGIAMYIGTHCSLG